MTARILSFLDEQAARIALSAVLLALVLGGGYAVLLGGELRFLDEHVYLELTRSMVEGHGYAVDGNATAYRPPGYSFLLLPVHLLTGGSVFALRLIGVACLAGSVWLLYLLGRRTGSAAAGALAAVVLACSPLLVYTATALYPQLPALLLLLAMLECGLRARDGAHRLRDTVLSGLSAGLLTVTVPSFGPTLLLVVFALVWRRRGGWRAATLLVAVAAVLPGLWCVRNAVQLHALIPVSTNNGVNLLLGNNPGTTPGSGTSVDISAYDARAKELRLDEVGIDEFYRDSAVEWITANPGDAAVLYAGKVAHNFVHSDSLKTTGQGASDLLAALSYYPVLALAGLRLLLARRFPLRGVEKLALAVIVLNVLLLAVFFTRVRFRVPLDALTILLAASCAVQLLRLLRDRERVA
ncbi:ArnT family glycosyltransferase [Amycolatopsis nigrescens]|uniref:ArnT family glycosyltransferase n=1 Tax=Amycolatopsis nigrescens TaxID=381445 RepID=UPI00036C5A25|nr:glycosyltransferase family 39 protein [Amycolatopsis nigrescens]